MKPYNGKLKMTIRFEGLTSGELDKLHQAVAATKTETHTCGKLVWQDGDGVKFVEVGKVEKRREEAFYTAIVEVHPIMEGWIYPPLEGNDRRWGLLWPSRKGLEAIFDAVNVLPETEQIADKPVPASHGGRC